MAKKNPAQYFRTKPWTHEEVERLFAENAEFRKVARKAAKTLLALNSDDAPEIEENGRELAFKMISVCNALGDDRLAFSKSKNKLYPHPAILLTWIVNAAEFADESRFGVDGGSAKLLQTGPAIAFFGPLLSSFRLPGKLSRYWADFWSKPHGNSKLGKVAPHWFTNGVHPLAVPTKSASLRGFVLESLEVAIPHGMVPARSRKRAGENPYYLPAGIETFRITFADENRITDAQNQFGETWLGVTADGKSIFLASERTPKIDFAELIFSMGKRLFSAAGTADLADVIPFSSEGRGYQEKKRPAGFAENASSRARSLAGQREAIKNIDQRQRGNLPAFPTVDSAPFSSARTSRKDVKISIRGDGIDVGEAQKQRILRLREYAANVKVASAK